MAKLRYVKTLEQVAKAAESNPEFLDSTVRSIRAVYETDPAIAEALVPKPLEVEKPEIRVTFSHVAMHISPEFTFEIGSAIFGVAATYEGVAGTYLVTLPMTTEAWPMRAGGGVPLMYGLVHERSAVSRTYVSLT